MIYEVLNFLRSRLDVYLSGDEIAAEPLIHLAAPWANNDQNKGSAFLNAISLINIEEEKVFKTQTPIITRKRSDSPLYTTRAPDLKLNFFVLISAYSKNYEDALRTISRILTFFQTKNVFLPDPQKPHDFPDRVEQITLDLYTASFEQQNQIWASLSTGYLPSIIYKIRTMTIDADQESEDAKTILEIKVNSRLIERGQSHSADTNVINKTN